MPQCTYRSERGTCRKRAIVGQPFCTSHTCAHAECSNNTSSKETFCRVHGGKEQRSVAANAVRHKALPRPPPQATATSRKPIRGRSKTNAVPSAPAIAPKVAIRGRSKTASAATPSVHGGAPPALPQKRGGVQKQQRSLILSNNTATTALTTASSTDGDLIFSNDSNDAAATASSTDGDALWDTPVVADYHFAAATPAVAGDCAGGREDLQVEAPPSENSNTSQDGGGGGTSSSTTSSSSVGVSQFDGMGKIKLLNLCRKRGLDSEPYLKDIEGLKRLLANSMMANHPSETASDSVHALPPPPDASRALHKARRQSPAYVAAPKFSMLRRPNTSTSTDTAETAVAGENDLMIVSEDQTTSEEVVVNYHFAAATPVNAEEVGQPADTLVLNPMFTDLGLQRSSSDQMDPTPLSPVVSGMMLRSESDEVGGGGATIDYSTDSTEAPVLPAKGSGWNFSGVASRMQGAMTGTVNIAAGMVGVQLRGGGGGDSGGGRGDDARPDSLLDGVRTSMFLPDDSSTTTTTTATTNGFAVAQGKRGAQITDTDIGSECFVTGIVTGAGYVRYVGKSFSENILNGGRCIGVEMIQKTGEKSGHNGVVEYHTYFMCTEGHGLLVDPEHVFIESEASKRRHLRQLIARKAADKTKEEADFLKLQEDAKASDEAVRKITLQEEAEKQLKIDEEANRIAEGVERVKKQAQEEGRTRAPGAAVVVGQDIRPSDGSKYPDSSVHPVMHSEQTIAEKLRMIENDKVKVYKALRAEEVGDRYLEKRWIKHFLSPRLASSGAGIYAKPPKPPATKRSAAADDDVPVAGMTSDQVADNEDEMAEHAKTWLVNLLEHSYLDSKRKDGELKLKDSKLKESLFAAKDFVSRFTDGGHFTKLQQMLHEKCAGLGTELAKSHLDHKLSMKLSEKRVRRNYEFHACVPRDAAGNVLNPDNVKITNFDIIPELRDGLGILSYDAVENMDEMAALQVILITAKLSNKRFQQAVQDVAGQYTNIDKETGKCAFPGSKAFPRAYSKGESVTDYRYDDKPRAAGNLKDGLRNLIVVRTVADLLGLINALSKRFGGLAKVKNPFGTSEAKQEERHHLLLMNITIVFEAGPAGGGPGTITYSDLLAEPESVRLLEAYKATPQCDSTDRWEESVDQAQAFMAELGSRNKPVRVLAEVQVAFEIDFDVRDVMHYMYDVTRAQTMLEAFPVKKVIVSNAFASLDPRMQMLECVKRGGSQIIQELIVKRGDVNAEHVEEGFGFRMPLLSIAALRNNADTVAALLKHGATIDNAKWPLSPLSVAARAGATDAVQLLLSHGANLEHASSIDDGSTGAEGMTPLMHGCLSGFHDTVAVLIKANADVKATAKMGTTALHYASKDSAVVNQLVSAGAVLNATCELGTSPLHQAVCRADFTVVQALLETDGILVDACNNQSKMTPFTLGCFLGDRPDHLKCLKLLVERNAYLQFASRHGTALGIVRERENLGRVLKGQLVDFISDSVAKEHANEMRNTSEGASMLLASADVEAKIKAVETEEQEFHEYVKHQLWAVQGPWADACEIADAVLESLADLQITSLNLLLKKCQVQYSSAISAISAIGSKGLTKEQEETLGIVEYHVNSALTDLPLLYAHRMLDVFRMNLSQKAYNAKIESSKASQFPPPVVISKWRSDRYSFFEQRNIDKQRKINRRANRMKASIHGKGGRIAAAKGLSQDALINTQMLTESHREESKSELPGVVGLPGTPDLPDSKAIRDMIREEVEDTWCTWFCCSGGKERKLTPVNEAQFKNISVGVQWKYSLQTEYQYRLLSHNVIPADAKSIASLFKQVEDDDGELDVGEVHDSAELVDWDNLPSVWDFTTVELEKKIVGPSGSSWGFPLHGSIFKFDCALCASEGIIDCYKCEGAGRRRCHTCLGSGRDDGSVCYTCDGSGDKKCSKCKGKGKLTCSDCGGACEFVAWLGVHKTKDVEKMTKSKVESVEAGKKKRWVDSDFVHACRGTDYGAPNCCYKDSRSYDPDVTMGPAIPNAYHSERLQPIEIIDKELTDAAVEGFKNQHHTTNFFFGNGRSLDPVKKGCWNIESLKGADVLTDFDGQKGDPGFRLVEQRQWINWGTEAKLVCDVPSLDVSYNAHLSYSHDPEDPKFIAISTLDEYPANALCWTWGQSAHWAEEECCWLKFSTLNCPIDCHCDSKCNIFCTSITAACCIPCIALMAVDHCILYTFFSDYSMFGSRDIRSCKDYKCRLAQLEPFKSKGDWPCLNTGIFGCCLAGNGCTNKSDSGRIQNDDGEQKVKGKEGDEDEVAVEADGVVDVQPQADSSDDESTD